MSPPIETPTRSTAVDGYVSWTNHARSCATCSIGTLSSLRELHLRGNLISVLPESIGELTELRQLDLRENALTTLPPSLLKLSKLDKLDLRWNRNLHEPSWLPDLEEAGCMVLR